MQAALDKLGTSGDPLRRQLGKLLTADLAGLAEPGEKVTETEH